MQQTHKKFPKRTLITLAQDYESFKASGGNIKKRKNFNNNVIDEPLFRVPLDQVRIIISLLLKTPNSHNLINTIYIYNIYILLKYIAFYSFPGCIASTSYITW